MITSNRRSGLETFISTGFQLQEFRQWACSDLLSATQIEIPAEFLVAKAVGSADGVRIEQDAVKVVAPCDIRVEVKSSASVKAWNQDKQSNIRFMTAPTRSWAAQAIKSDAVATPSADVWSLYCQQPVRKAVELWPGEF